MSIKLIKKESMERCDSCGAVMTEYDYDRYGGLCKYCRSKGETKKSERRPSYYDHPLIMAITYKGSTIYCGTEDGDMWSNDIEDAYVWDSFDTISTIAVENFVAVAKEALETRWISEDNVEYLPAPIGTDDEKKSETAPDEYARGNFLEGALDYAEIEDDKGNVVLLKLTKRYANEIGGDFCLRAYDGETDKSLAMGGIRYVVGRFGELLDMDPAEAIIEIAKE